MNIAPGTHPISMPTYLSMFLNPCSRHHLTDAAQTAGWLSCCSPQCSSTCSLQCRVVQETSSLKADIAQATQPGDLPTVTTTQDGTVQLLTNNNSGDEIQFRKDGTFTFVNGGDSPGIFSVSTTTPPNFFGDVQVLPSSHVCLRAPHLHHHHRRHSSR